jgi:hypothetical protein
MDRSTTASRTVRNRHPETNNDQQATITVVKEVINNNGGSAGPNDFGLTLDGTGTTSGTPVDVDPGDHTAAEAGLAGYTFTGFSGDCDSNGDITIALGESKTCTLTNNDQAATLVVIKHVINDNGGTAVAADFTLDSGGTNDSPDDFARDELGTTVSLDAGSYGVTETGPPGLPGPTRLTAPARSPSARPRPAR